MKQAELVKVIKNIPGFKGLYHRAEDFRDKDAEGHTIPGTGKQQIYTVWQRTNGVLRSHRIDMLVLDKGTPEETAEPFTPLEALDPAPAPFQQAVSAAAIAYQGADTKIQKVIITNCDEVNELAFLTSYEERSGLQIINEIRKIAYKSGDEIIIKDFNKLAE